MSLLLVTLVEGSRLGQLIFIEGRRRLKMTLLVARGVGIIVDAQGEMGCFALALLIDFLYVLQISFIL